VFEGHFVGGGHGVVLKLERSDVLDICNLVSNSILATDFNRDLSVSFLADLLNLSLKLIAFFLLIKSNCSFDLRSPLLLELSSVEDTNVSYSSCELDFLFNTCLFASSVDFNDKVALVITR
jgi:hypothetical protein